MTPPLYVLCFGDSLTQGYHGYGSFIRPYSETLEEKLREAFPGREIKIVTSGVPGDMVCNSRFLTRMNDECRFYSFPPLALERCVQFIVLESRILISWPNT